MVPYDNRPLSTQSFHPTSQVRTVVQDFKRRKIININGKKNLRKCVIMVLKSPGCLFSHRHQNVEGDRGQEPGRTGGGRGREAGST